MIWVTEKLIDFIEDKWAAFVIVAGIISTLLGLVLTVLVILALIKYIGH